MNKREEFVSGLKTFPKKVEILLVDDDSEFLEEQIKSTIVCGIKKEEDLNIMLERVLDDKRIGILSSYQAIFFDATYKNEKSNVSTIDIVEKIAQKRPEYLEKIVILIADDVRTAGRFSEDSETSLLISRIGQLPHIGYGIGKRNKTKLECIVKFIELKAREKGFEAPRKYVHGICDNDLLQKVDKYMNKIATNLTEQRDLSIELSEFLKGKEPENETERVILSGANAIAKVLFENYHIISNRYTVVNNNCKRAKKEIDEGHDTK